MKSILGPLEGVVGADEVAPLHAELGGLYQVDRAREVVVGHDRREYTWHGLLLNAPRMATAALDLQHGNGTNVAQSIYVRDGEEAARAYLEKVNRASSIGWPDGAQNAAAPRRAPCEVCGDLAFLRPLLIAVDVPLIAVCDECFSPQRAPVPRRSLWLRFLRWLASV